MPEMGAVRYAGGSYITHYEYTVTNMATITKKELASRISAETQNRYTHKEVLDVLQKAVDLITEAVGRGDKVVLRKFGIFAVKEVKAKVGRNPKNPGTDIPIPARSIVKFKMGKTLKETLAKASK